MGFLTCRSGDPGRRCAAKAAAFETVGDLMQAFAGKVYCLGDRVGVGPTVKMINPLAVQTGAQSP